VNTLLGFDSDGCVSGCVDGWVGALIRISFFQRRLLLHCTCTPQSQANQPPTERTKRTNPPPTHLHRLRAPLRHRHRRELHHQLIERPPHIRPGRRGPQRDAAVARRLVLVALRRDVGQDLDGVHFGALEACGWRGGVGVGVGVGMGVGVGGGGVGCWLGGWGGVWSVGCLPRGRKPFLSLTKAPFLMTKDPKQQSSKAAKPQSHSIEENSLVQAFLQCASVFPSIWRPTSVHRTAPLYVSCCAATSWGGWGCVAAIGG